MKEQRWQDWTNVLLGGWLVLAPLAGVGVTGDAAAINSYVIGSAVVLFAFAAITSAAMWKEYSNLVLGIWLIVAPFALGFTNLAGPMWNQIVAGFAIGGVALAVILQKSMPTIGHGGHGHGHA